MNEFRPDYISLPGETLLEVLDSIGMSQAELARRTGRPKKTINEIIQGKAAITPETALQLELVLGIPTSFWINREQQYQEAKARIAEEEQLESQVGWLDEMRTTIQLMCDWGWIECVADEVSQVRETLRFYGVASVNQWQVVYASPDALFRQSTARPIEWSAVTAWLRKGELDAQVMDCQPYDANRFHEALQETRSLTRQPVKNVWSTIVAKYADAGVAVVLTPAFPNTGISGATRWLSPQRAILQLSLRYKRDDQLWFSFFHEAGHILRHGKKNLYLEQDEQPDNLIREEAEANKFAADLLIPPGALRKFVSQHTRRFYSEKDVVQFAKSLGIAPGIVVGRLQRDDKLPPSHLNKLKQKLEWGEWATNNV